MELNDYIISNPTRGIPDPLPFKPVRVKPGSGDGLPVGPASIKPGSGSGGPLKPEGGPDVWAYPTIPGGEEKVI